MDELTSVRLRITGLVQGVGFRESMCTVAEALQVNGWVRNRPDGSVQAVLQGAKEDVERLVDWCHNGPPGASVRYVEIEVLEAGEVSTSFERRPSG
jgi:acylphosphatase